MVQPWMDSQPVAAILNLLPMSLKRTRLNSSLPQTPKWTLPDQHRRKRLDVPATNGKKESEAPKEQEQQRPAVTPLTTTSKRRLKRRIAPLELLQQPLQAGVRKVFDLRRMLYVVGLTIGVLLLPTPEGLSLEGHRALALFVFTGSILALEPAPLPIAALLVPIGQIALSINEARGAFAPFGNPVLFLILGSLFLAEALRKHGLTRRLALYAIIQSGGNFRALVLGLMLITGVLSMWVLNTATTAVLIPVAITIAQRVQRPEEAKRAFSERFVELMVVGARDLEVEVTLPPGFRREAIEAFAPDDVESAPPSHLLPMNGALVYHERLSTCAPDLAVPDAAVTLTVTYRRGDTFEYDSFAVSTTIGELLQGDHRLLHKGAGIVRYAEALRLWNMDPSASDVFGPVAKSASDRIAMASKLAPNDVSLIEIQTVLEVILKSVN